MKLKHILPVTLLAVLALAACDPEVLTLGGYVDDLPVGVQAEGVLEDILALLPAADVGFTTQTQDYLEYSSVDNYQLETSVVASRYDNDVLEVVLDSQVAQRVDGVWGEFAPNYSSIETVWADATNINYVYEEDGDPLNAYSFALAADANNEVLDGYLASVGAVDDIEYGIASADEAYNFYVASTDWNYVTIGSSVEKVAAAGEDPEYVVVEVASNIGYMYSGQLAWGAGNEGVFVERYYNYGVKFYIVDGVVDYIYLDEGSMFQILYTDSAATSETPAPVIAGTSETPPSPMMTNAEWDTYVTNVPTVSAGELTYGASIYYYDISFSSESNGAYNLAELPDFSAFRVGDASDAGYWIDIEAFLA